MAEKIAPTVLTLNSEKQGQVEISTQTYIFLLKNPRDNMRNEKII